MSDPTATPGDHGALEFAIPYFGTRARLEETVASIQAQTSPHWRLLVVEDGDQGYDVGTWLTGLGDPRIRHVLNPHNLGVSGNFQRCLDLAGSAFLTFPGCDDRVGPDYVRAVRETWQRFPRSGAVIPGVRVIDQAGEPTSSVTDRVKAQLRPRRAGALGGQDLLTSLMHGNWTYFPATSWKREVIVTWGFRDDLPTTLDLALLSELILQGESVTVLDEEHFEYRRHRLSASSLTATSGERFAEERALYGELARKAAGMGWDRAARAARWRLTSRAHALSLVPRQLPKRGVRSLLRHALR